MMPALSAREMVNVLCARSPSRVSTATRALSTENARSCSAPRSVQKHSTISGCRASEGPRSWKRCTHFSGRVHIVLAKPADLQMSLPDILIRRAVPLLPRVL